MNGSAKEPVPDAEVTDQLPADLNLETFESDYVLPNNNRRRIPAAMYLVIAAACGVAWFLWRDESPLVNDGVGLAAVGLALFAIYGFIAGRTLNVDETEALGEAAKTVGFPVGHASAQMVWRGWLSTPVWRLLVYSAENPPTKRALVVVDGYNGKIVEWFAEENPEEWANTTTTANSSLK